MPQDDGQSTIRRRSITGGQEQRQPRYPKSMERNVPPRTDGPFSEDDLFPDGPRTNTSVVRYTGPSGQIQRTAGALSTTGGIPSRRQTGTKNSPRIPRSTTTQQRPNNPKSHKRVHWLLPLGVGMVAMLVLWMVGSTIVTWGVQRYYDVHYGNPRTSQTDAVVGHNHDSEAHKSHFIAVNLNRRAIVVELMGGDPAKAKTYVAPVYIDGPGGDLAPVDLEFRDVTGDSKKDMIIHIHLPSQDQISVFINEGTQFRPSDGNDKVHI
jgi:hypothetical protein